MKISELKDCPAWLLEANTVDADVEIRDGVVHWWGGTWLGGNWLGGTWLGGNWLGGIWQYGTWEGGVWLGGVWQGGNWLGGTWQYGIWQGGNWLGGNWLGGVWLGGNWLGGHSSPMRCRWRVLIVGSGIQIGCKTKTIAEWDAWFAGTEEFTTQRGTPEFELIQAAYLGARAALQFLLDVERLRHPSNVAVP